MPHPPPVLVALHAAAWLALTALGLWLVRRELERADRAWQGWILERARRDALGLSWVELKSEEGIELLVRDGDRLVTREATHESWHGNERMTLRAGVPASGWLVPIEPLTGVGDVCVLARVTDPRPGYREDGSALVLEPDPDHGYRFGRERDPDPPRGARRYASALAFPLGAMTLAFVPFLGSIVAFTTFALVLAEVALFARTRVFGGVTFSFLSLLGEKSDGRARRRAERARERDREWD